MLILANSLVTGFFKSNLVGQGIVLAQLFGSVIMLAVIVGKWMQLKGVSFSARRFLNDFAAGGTVLEYYMARRPQKSSGIEGIYKLTAERLLNMISPDARARLVARQASDGAALSAREIELVKGTCDHILDEEELRVESGMGWIATVVALAPMLGLLGTVWGVLDAFDEMGAAGSANLATIAPSISAALVTTVVGLLVAIPGVVCFNALNAMIRNLTSDMEGFADELIGRIACEFQGLGA